MSLYHFSCRNYKSSTTVNCDQPIITFSHVVYSSSISCPPLICRPSSHDHLFLVPTGQGVAASHPHQFAHRDIELAMDMRVEETHISHALHQAGHDRLPQSHHDQSLDTGDRLKVAKAGTSTLVDTFLVHRLPSYSNDDLHQSAIHLNYYSNLIPKVLFKRSLNVCVSIFLSNEFSPGNLLFNNIKTLFVDISRFISWMLNA